MAQKLCDAFAEHWLGMAQAWIRDSLDWSGVSANPIITPAVLEAHPELPWDDQGLVFNESMTWSVFRTRLSRLGQHLQYLSEHPCIDAERASSFPSAHWDWQEIYSSPRMTLERLEATCRAAPDPVLARHYILACGVCNVPFSYIVANSDIPWCLFERSAVDPQIQDHVQQAPCLAWDLANMSRNPHISLDFVERTGYLVNVLEAPPLFGVDGTVTSLCRSPYVYGEWDWTHLSANPGILMADLEREELPWVWAAASSNPNLSWEFVMDHLHYDWNWSQLSATLPLDRILADGMSHPSHPWSMRGLSRHPEVGWDTVAAHPEREWVGALLLRNPMPQYQQRWMAATARKWCAARRLQRFARDVTCNPVFAAARRIRVTAL